MASQVVVVFVVAAVAESRRVGLGRASYIASSSICSICSSCSNVEQKNKPGEEDKLSTTVASGAEE